MGGEAVRQPKCRGLGPAAAQPVVASSCDNRAWRSRAMLLQFCFNQCNGRGECVGGFCNCDPGRWVMVCKCISSGACFAHMAAAGRAIVCQSMPHPHPLARWPACCRLAWLRLCAAERSRQYHSARYEPAAPALLAISRRQAAAPKWGACARLLCAYPCPLQGGRCSGRGLQSMCTLLQPRTSRLAPLASGRSSTCELAVGHRCCCCGQYNCA